MTSANKAGRNSTIPHVGEIISDGSILGMNWHDYEMGGANATHPVSDLAAQSTDDPCQSLDSPVGEQPLSNDML